MLCGYQDGGDMRQPQTLWPLGNGIRERKVNDDGIPVWALSDPKSALPQYRPWWMIGGVLLFVALIIGSSVVDFSIVNTLFLVFALAILLAVVVQHFQHVTTLRNNLEAAARWNDTIFQRSDICLWREDWTAARDAVLRALRAGERDMQAYFAARPEELREIRSKVIIKDVNEAAVIRAGLADKGALLGSLERLLPDTDQTFLQWLVAFAGGDTVYRSETHITLSGGETRDTLFSAALPRDMRDFENILVSDLDITEYKAAQARAAQAETEIARATRITMMGALSASIAHEVNSPLAAIVASSEAALLWLQRENPDIEEAISAMQTVNQQACRAQNVVERTRAYLNNTPAAVTSQPIGTLIYEALQLIQRELRELKASAHVSVLDDLPLVLADPINIQQVLVNLILNAAQAMEDKPGPRDISIGAEVDDKMMLITVSDFGPGIEAEMFPVIFDPFYSTRKDGMGMGLAICRTCIGAHGGQIWVTNKIDSGAQFHFTLPLAQ